MRVDYRSLESRGWLRRQEKTRSKKKSVLRANLQAGLETEPSGMAKGNKTEELQRTQDILIKRVWPKLGNIYQSWLLWKVMLTKWL